MIGGGRLGLSRRALERAYVRPASRFETVEGVRLHYLGEGPPDGPCVVVLSAQWASFSQWHGWAAQFTDRYRVVRLDLPGQGLSGPMASDDYSIDAYLKLFTGFADRLGLQDFFLVGTSFSGPVAYRYAATVGHRLRGLILANASGLPRTGAGPAPNPDPPGWWLKRIWKRCRPAAFFRWKLDQLLQDKAKITPQRVREYTEMNNARGRIAETEARLRDYRSVDPSATLAAIGVPVLVQWSTHATYLPAVDADRFLAGLTNAPARKIVYPGVGHLIIEDAPEATGRDARAFADGVMAARAPA